MAEPAAQPPTAAETPPPRRLIHHLTPRSFFRGLRRLIVRPARASLERILHVTDRFQQLEHRIQILDRRLARIEDTVRQLHITPVGRHEIVARDMRNYQQQVEANYADLSDSFDAYRQLVDGLIRIDRQMIIPACELAEPPTHDARRLALRHDVDADPITALRMARFLARRGVPGSFYLLHTAPYYGEFHGHLFIRTPQLPRWIRAFIVAGCELGVHNDALGASQIPGVNGAHVLQTEIQWLRSLGAPVKGTAAHNSLPVYGAENYEVFVGHRLWDRTPTSITGEPLPLEALSEAELGLTYEGTFALPRTDVDTHAADAFARDRAAADIRNPAWMQTYLSANPVCRWAVDLQIWIVARNRWVIGGSLDRQPLFIPDLSLADVLDFVNDLTPPANVLIVLHPEYMRQ